MVCAKQDQSAAVLVTKEEQNLDQLQQQHLFNNQQTQTQEHPHITTIVLFTRTNDQQHHQNQQQQQQELTITTTLPQQRHQSLLAVKSQQLKKQHASLVKLLESAPIKTTSKKSLPSPVIGKGSLTPKIAQTEPHEQHIVFLKQTKNKNIHQQITNQPQHHKRLKTNNDSVIITHTPTTKMQLQQEQHHLESQSQLSTAPTTLSEHNNKNLDTKMSVSMSYEKDILQQPPAMNESEIAITKVHTQEQQTIENAVVLEKEGLNNSNKMDSESGIDDEDIDMLSGEDEHHKILSTNNNKIATTGDNMCFYEHYQCPWKKIRYAREWKQRQEQNTKEQNQEIEQKLQQKHKEVTIMLQQKEREVEVFPKQQQEFNQCQQKKRRDSTDSNSSLISNSSTNSSTTIYNKTPTNFCTCNINKAHSRHSLQQTVNDDLQPQQQQIDNDSGCDDEVMLCAEHQQKQMNFLCQKFDNNLETSERNLNLEENIDIESSESNLNGFFRRSIQQKIQYRPCTKNQQCSILRINRNRCQYCRLKKCIAVGMSRDAVRFGRVPKREKARILAAMQQSTQNRGQQRALATELDDQPRLLAAVLRAHLDTCEFTKEKVLDMRQKARDCPSFSMPTLLACPLNPAPELQSEQEFSQRFAHIIRGVIDFAGMIPGFQLLTQDDKFTLLKAGLFDALFVRLICMFDSSINSIICLNGQVMRRDAIQNGANARFLVDSTFNFAERMNSMNLSDAEIGLFCAIVLITPDRPGLRNIELVEKMYSRLKGCLQTVSNQNRPDQPDFMFKLMDTMPDLRTLSTLHTEKLVVFRTEHKEMLRQQMWSLDDDAPRANSRSPPASSTSSTGGGWLGDELDAQLDVMAVGGTSSTYGASKSQLGYVSSTETAGDNEDNTTQKQNVLISHNASTHISQPQFPLVGCCPQQQQQPAASSLTSSAPLLVATLSSGSNISSQSRNRANSGSSGDSGTAEIDLIVGSHAHLTQNGLTITPIARSAPQQQQQQLHHHLNSGATVNRYRKLDSPTDSGIESGNEKTECGSKAVSSGGSSSCSSPRSSVDDALECTEANPAASVTRCTQPMVLSSSSVASIASTSPSSNALKRQIVDDMPVLKRVLQAPPLYDTNSLMDEAYKPHKKFRAMRHREFETAEADASCSTSSLSSTHSNAPASMTASTITTTPFSREQTPPPLVAAVSAAPQPTTANSQLQVLMSRPPTLNQTSASSSSFLSSTHSVLAKSLLAEPRMTPEQIKRSDIIQNYIMRESSPTSSASSTTPTRLDSRSPATTSQHQLVPGELISSQPQHEFLHNHALLNIQRHPPTSSINSNLSNTSNALVESSPPSTSPGRWQPPTSLHHVHNGSGSTSVITTTTNTNQRQISEVPGNNKHHQYIQSPHSTSSPASLNSSSSAVCVPSPNLLELQVEIADSQQPLNLSKKSPTPPPSNMQALVSPTTTAQQQQRYNSADPTVSADGKLISPSSSTVAETETERSSSLSKLTPTSTPSPKTLVHHKVLLEA